MKKCAAWLLAFLLTGALILFSVTFLGREAIAPAMKEEGAPVSDTVIAREQTLLKQRIDAMAGLYSLPAEQVTEMIGEDTLRDLNSQASRWLSSILTTGKPTDGIEWNTDRLEQLLDAAPARVDLPAARAEDISRSVTRMVLPVRREIIETGLKKVRERADLPNLITFFLGIPWAALALCALLAGLIALLESREFRRSLLYVGSAMGAAAIVLAALAGLFLSAGIAPMIQEASKSLTILYEDLMAGTGVRAVILFVLLAAGCAVCLIFCRRSRRAV